MAKRFLSILSAASLVAVLAPVSVTTSAAEVNCQVPFSFAVSGKTLPPGRYILSTDQNNALKISGFNHGVIVLGTPMDSGTETSPKLVFEKYGDQYTLREVWMGGSSGRELPLSHSERDRRKEARNGQVERIVVPAL